MNNSVIFFTQNRWAFGQIHHALIKHLWKHGIYSNLLDWSVSYTQKEQEYLRRGYRLASTIPDAVHHLVAYGWPLDRICAVAHCECDLVNGINNSGLGMFENLYSFGVVNPHLIDTCIKLGIRRMPTVLKVGVDADHFSAPLPVALKIVGYAAAKTFPLSDGQDCKRGHLAEKVAKEVGLNFRAHEFYHHLSMPGYYRDVDAVLVTSNYETVSLPGLEAAAAGRLVISTRVGYFDGSYGVLCRNDEAGFVEDAAKALRQFAEKPSLFRDACASYQNSVRKKHGWSTHVAEWVSFFL